MGTSLRTVIAVFIVAKYRLLSDRVVIKQVKENRYIQYFCNVPDEDLPFFMDHSNLSKLRKRFGIEGMEAIDSVVLDLLRVAKVIEKDGMLIDSTVLLNNISYPTDIGLMFKALEKIKQFANSCQIPVWWDEQEVKELWREYNLNRKQTETINFFFDFILILSDALRKFEEIVQTLEDSDKNKEKALQLLELLISFQDQNEQKLEGEQHIPNRIVSLDEPDARPINIRTVNLEAPFSSRLTVRGL